MWPERFLLKWLCSVPQFIRCTEAWLLSFAFFSLISVFASRFFCSHYFFLLGFLLDCFGKNAEKRQNGLQATVENVVVMATSLVNAKRGEFIKTFYASWYSCKIVESLTIQINVFDQWSNNVFTRLKPAVGRLGSKISLNLTLSMETSCFWNLLSVRHITSQNANDYPDCFSELRLSRL